jgi:hypothetical protein
MVDLGAGHFEVGLDGGVLAVRDVNKAAAVIL